LCCMLNLDVIFGWACQLLGGFAGSEKIIRNRQLASLHPTVKATGSVHAVFVRAYKRLIFGTPN
jgi:hypothetical protein